MAVVSAAPVAVEIAFKLFTMEKLWLRSGYSARRGLETAGNACGDRVPGIAGAVRHAIMAAVYVVKSTGVVKELLCATGSQSMVTIGAYDCMTDGRL